MEPKEPTEMSGTNGDNPRIPVLRSPSSDSTSLDAVRLKSLAAVRNGRVVDFEDQALSRLGPSVIDATEALCRTLARVSHGNY